MMSTINFYSDDLKSRYWSQSISRAAVSTKLPFLTGIELKYHNINKDNIISVDSFLNKYKHTDVLLEDKDIKLFKDQINDERLEERTNLYSDYKIFLDKLNVGTNNKQKAYNTVFHDATLLDFVRNQRTAYRGSLEAGALILTMDYKLYRFDWLDSRNKQIEPCSILPSLFWQILKLYVPSDHDCDRAFAQTFAIPEFLALNATASSTCKNYLLN